MTNHQTSELTDLRVAFLDELPTIEDIENVIQRIDKYVSDTLDRYKAELIEQLPKERDEYYGMVCQDFGHCIPGYMDIESVEWYNELLAQVKDIIQNGV